MSKSTQASVSFNARDANIKFNCGVPQSDSLMEAEEDVVELPLKMPVQEHDDREGPKEIILNEEEPARIANASGKELI